MSEGLRVSAVVCPASGEQRAAGGLSSSDMRLLGASFCALSQLLLLGASTAFTPHGTLSGWHVVLLTLLSASFLAKKGLRVCRVLLMMLALLVWGAAGTVWTGSIMLAALQLGVCLSCRYIAGLALESRRRYRLAAATAC